uniref:Cornifelin n=1 Tax=Nothobranchius furzeri TaxID=105023 RepID=A0A8C6L3U3_NOTFU
RKKGMVNQPDIQPLTGWDSGLFDCFEDASTCCYGFWCFPCLACTVTGRFGEFSCLPACDIFCGGPVPPVALAMRVAMRNKYGIKGSIGKDLMTSCCCAVCSWCQMHRELKHRKEAPVVINMQSQTVVMQPAPMMMMAPAYPPPVHAVSTGFVQAH